MEPNGAVDMGGDKGDLVCVGEGEVSVYEDEDIGDGAGEGEDIGNGGPGARVGVKDNGEKRGCLIRGGDLVVVRDVNSVHDRLSDRPDLAREGAVEEVTVSP